ncbi:hypothetical protein OG800_01675 [Streptomyces sp. NBC_00445]|uniref:hypothetical protein n=1 Tax=unclassified Streptomyces TaxID=2593676 RepID=UPI002E1A8FAF|nr:MULTISPECIES: hypothetical protein [unclassified Streptomyces]
MSDDRRRAHDDREPDDRRWLDEPRNVTRIVYGLAALCALALLADFFYTKHPYFSVERWPGFYAVFGFVASVTLVLTAKGLRRLLRRDEDYYEPSDLDRSEAPERGRDND